MSTITKVALKETAERKVKRTSLTSKGKNYLTKRILISAARAGFTAGATKTKEIMGFNVVAKNGWVVKIYKDGSIEKVSKIDKGNNQSVVLD